MDEEKLAATAYFLGMVHDIGKATALFQCNITRSNPEMRIRWEKTGQFTGNFRHPKDVYKRQRWHCPTVLRTAAAWKPPFWTRS